MTIVYKGDDTLTFLLVAQKLSNHTLFLIQFVYIHESLFTTRPLENGSKAKKIMFLVWALPTQNFHNQFFLDLMLVGTKIRPC